MHWHAYCNTYNSYDFYPNCTKFTSDGKRSNGMISFWHCRRSSSSLSTAHSGKFYCQTLTDLIEHVYIVDLFISENVLCECAPAESQPHTDNGRAPQLYVLCVRAKLLFKSNTVSVLKSMSEVGCRKRQLRETLPVVNINFWLV